jgi:hypothetical protein
MAGNAGVIRTYLEIGGRRVFAGSLDWPGWCRSGRDEEGALRALFAYGPRYASSAARGEAWQRPLRSGAYWLPRYAVRRVGWHALDHAWEIEDRAL